MGRAILIQHFRKLVAAVAVAALLHGGAASAAALALSQATLFVDVDEIRNVSSQPVDGIHAVLFESSTAIFLLDYSALGPGAEALAEADLLPEPPTVGHMGAVGQNAVASADVPSRGSAFASSLTDGFLSIKNTSAADTFEVDLKIDWFVGAAALTDSPATGEDAYAYAGVAILSSLLDGFILYEFVEVDDSDAQVFEDTPTITLTLAPTASESWYLLADAEAGAIPAPGGLALLLPGLLMLAGRRRNSGSSAVHP
jgi:hypothetical protein